MLSALNSGKILQTLKLPNQSQDFFLEEIYENSPNIFSLGVLLYGLWCMVEKIYVFLTMFEILNMKIEKI